MMKQYIQIILGLCALSACAPHEIDLAYYCEPSGATIYEEGMGMVGACPVTLKYNPYDVAVSHGQIHTNNIKVVWASGASLLVPATGVDIRADGKASLTFSRPADFSNSEKDQKVSRAFESRLETPGIKYVVSPHQTGDAFGTLNQSVGCAFDGLIHAVYAQCP